MRIHQIFEALKLKEAAAEHEERFDGESSEQEDDFELTEEQKDIVAKTEDNSKIRLWLKIRLMSHVERASLAHSIRGYTLLTD